MKTGKYMPIIITVLLMIMFAYPFESMAVSKSAKTEKKLPVFCCKKGKIVQDKMTRSELMRNTNCSISLSEVKSFCGVCCTNGKTSLVSSNMEKNNCLQKRGKFYTRIVDCKPDNVYCCIKGKIKKTTLAECNKYRGKAYKTASEAKRQCRPVDVYCCFKGKVKKTSSAECKKYRGNAYKTAAEAKRQCRPVDVFCCIKGKVKKTTPAECKKYKAKAYKTAAEAKRQCRPVDVFCCIKGKVKKTTLAECKIYKAKAYKTAAEAKRQCRPVDIYCCVKGKVKKTSARECRKNRVKTYKTAVEAKRQCKVADVYCCIKGKVKKTSLRECRKNNEKGYSTLFKARQNCPGYGSGAADKKIKKDRKIILKDGPTVNNLAMLRKDKKRSRFDLLVAHLKKQTPLAPVGQVKGTMPTNIGLDKVPEIVPMRFDHGIAVTSPTREDTIYVGRPMKVNYRFLSDVVEGEVSVVLCDRETYTLVVSTTTSYQPGSGGPLEEVELDLPLDMDRSAPYVVLVSHPSGAYGESDVFSVREFSIGEGGTFGGAEGDRVPQGSPLDITMTATEVDNLSLEPNYSSYQPGDEVTVRIHSRKSIGNIFLSRSDTTMAFWPILWQYADGHQEYNSETGVHLVRLQLPDDDTGDQRWAITAVMDDSSSLSSPRIMVRSGNRLLPDGTTPPGSLVGVTMTEVEITPASISLEPNYGSYRPGEEVTVRIHSRHSLYEIYLSRSDTAMGFWPLLWQYADGHQEYNSETGDHLLRLQLPDDDTGLQGRAITVFLGESGSRLDSHHFLVTETEGRSPGNEVQIVLPGESEVWTMGTEQEVSWRVYGFDDPESLDFSLDLLNGNDVWSHLDTSDVRCDWSSGICSKTIHVSGSRMAGLARQPGDSPSSFRARFELAVKRGGHSGTTLATARSDRFAIVQPGIEILSPTGGEVFPLFSEIPVRIRVSGRNLGPFQVALYDPGYSINGRWFSPDGDIIPSDRTGEAVFPVSLTPDARTFCPTRGLQIRVISTSTPELLTTSGVFAVEMPELRVRHPASGDTWRNGETRTISWEVDIPLSAAASDKYRNQVILAHVGTGDLTSLADGIHFDASGRGRYRWTVGSRIHHPGALDDGDRGELPPGQYRIRIIARKPGSGDSRLYLPTMGARSGTFLIE